MLNVNMLNVLDGKCFTGYISGNAGFDAPPYFIEKEAETWGGYWPS